MDASFFKLVLIKKNWLGFLHYHRYVNLDAIMILRSMIRNFCTFGHIWKFDLAMEV